MELQDNISFPQQRLRPKRGCYARKSVQDRLDDRSIPEPNSGCYLWLGGVTGTGKEGKTGGIYGKITLRDSNGVKRHTVAHKVAYELAFGLVPEGLQLDHKCNNSLCVNPYHLEPVTAQVNSARRIVVNQYLTRAK